jgi:hypothetical protein
MRRLVLAITLLAAGHVMNDPAVAQGYPKATGGGTGPVPCTYCQSRYWAEMTNCESRSRDSVQQCKVEAFNEGQSCNRYCQR